MPQIRMLGRIFVSRPRTPRHRGVVATLAALCVATLVVGCSSSSTSTASSTTSAAASSAVGQRGELRRLVEFEAGERRVVQRRCIGRARRT